MQQITLPKYLNRIEGLLEENRLAEVGAHCHFILQQQPMHVRTYRLYARSLLEQYLLDDAADIFQRVLSADPEDIVAHAGLAEVYREKRLIAQAIWHMERAFEIDPYNRAVRAELNRLYTERDGVAPGNLDLTLEALVHLYVRGGQFDQATSELKDLLAEQPDRVDLQMLMAEALWRDKRTVEAADFAQDVLDQIPNCIKANAILVDALYQLGREVEAGPYWKRLWALTLLDGGHAEPDSIVDHAYRRVQGPNAPEVVVNRLEYFTAESPAAEGADWLNTGEAGSVRAKELPEWLAEMDRGPADAVSEAPPAEGDDVMDWLKEVASAEELAAAEVDDAAASTPEAEVAGSGTPSAVSPSGDEGEEPEPVGKVDDSPETAVPGWQPTELEGDEEHDVERTLSGWTSPPAESEEQAPSPDWVREMLGIEPGPGDKHSEPAPERLVGAVDAEGDRGEPAEPLPDWLLEAMGLADGASMPAGSEESMGTRAGLSGDEPSTEEEMAKEQEPSGEGLDDLTEGADADLDWLASLREEPQAEGSTDAAEKPVTPATETEAERAEVRSDLEETLVDWQLRADAADEDDKMVTIVAPLPGGKGDEADSATDVESSDDVIEEDLGWIDQLVAGEGEGIEEPAAASWLEDELSEEIQGVSEFDSEMSWLDELGQEATAESGEPDEEADEAPEDEEEAMAWLEQLAARQGAALEELPSIQKRRRPAMQVKKSWRSQAS
jgi:tetratricopeptide (TPR) repeat protein